MDVDGNLIFINIVCLNVYDFGLQWEEIVFFNVGFEFGFVNGCINGVVEYYIQNMNQLLFEVNVLVGINLFDCVLINIGEL